MSIFFIELFGLSRTQGYRHALAQGTGIHADARQAFWVVGGLAGGY